MFLSDSLQRMPADAYAAERQDHADDERGDRFDSTMAVRMIFVCGLDRDDHAEEDDT